MADFRKKQRIRRLLYSKASIVILFIILALAVRATWGVFQKSREAEKRKEETSARLSELEERERALSKEVESLSTAEGVERAIRDKFGAVKEGEGVIVIVPGEASPEVVSEGAFRGFLRRFLSFFGIGDQ